MAARRERRAGSSPSRIVDEYFRQDILYYDFCAAIRNVIVNLLDQGGFKYQLSWRVKSIDSIREKIARNAALGKVYRRLADIEDLAGIRVVFYLESEKRRFQAALMREMTRSRLQTEEHRKESGYRATHVLVQLGPKRAALNEYRRFAGLKCELQLTSALYHAWSEVEHDILYKRSPQASRLDHAVEARLTRELNEAMQRFIEPASNLLESVARRRRRGRARLALRRGRRP
jgi:ppGpp synthetase/RelA/SpoT-type nucleotidyltranferase